jgi:hypothetical protein
MVSVTPPERGARTVLGLSATNVRAMSSGSFAGGNGAWLASVRRGYLDLVLGLSGGDENLDPTYQDGFAKVRYRLGDRHVITAHALTAGDVLGYQDDESEPRVDSRYASHYGWLNWDATWGRVTTRTQASVGLLTWRRDGSHVPPGGGARDLSLLDRRRFEFAGARLDGWLDVTPAAGVSFGAERRGDAASYDYVKIERRLVVVNDSLRPRTDSVRFGRAPSGTRVAAWLAPRLRPFAALTIEPGVRYERSSSDGADWWSPRLHLALAAGARTTLRAGWGGYVQPQELYQLGVVDADTLFSLAETAEQRVLGIEYVTPRGLTLRAEAYERLLPSPRSRFSNLDGAQGAFPELSDDRVRVTPERGRVRGFELFAQREGARVSWSGSYAYSQGRDLVAGVWIPRELDQPHTLYVDFTYRLSGRWRVAWAWQYHSGWPITMAAFAVDTLSDGNVIITRSYPELRSERLPGYHRLDLRLTHEFPVRRGRLWAFVDVFNAYDRSNPRGSGYQLSYNGSRLSVRRVFETLFPRIPSFGLSWEF